MTIKTKLSAIILAASLLFGAPAFASQGSGCMPTTGTVSGLTLVQDINAGIAAIISTNSGATAPTTDCTVLSIKGQLWLDTSVTPNHLRIYDSANWLDLGAVDATGHLWKPPVGGGATTLASATTTDLCSVPDSYISISAANTITSFSNTCAAGTAKFLTFASTPQVTYNATTMILPGAASIVAQAGDSALVVYLGGGNWKALAWSRADGTSISQSSIFTGAIFFDSPQTVTLGGNTNDWNPTGLATLSVIRLTCSSAINVTGITAPATDGKIVIVDNVGATNNCTFTSQDTNSSAGNRFAFDRPLAVRPGRSIALKYDLTGTRWRLLQEITTQPIAGIYKNLRVFNAATAFGDTIPTTPNSQIKIAADEITVEDVNGGDQRLQTVACTVVASGTSFSAGSGGLDTGSLSAGNWYSVWVIFNPTTNTVSCLASLASTLGTITLPSGYTFGARVGWNYYWTNNSVTGFMRLIQYANDVHVIATVSSTTPIPTIIVSGSGGSNLNTNTPTWAVQSISTFVPPTASLLYAIVGTPVNISQTVMLAPNNTYGGYNTTATNLAPCIVAQFAVVSCIIALESTNVYYGSTGSSGYVGLYGWKDNL
jgi:hypothetical protein